MSDKASVYSNVPKHYDYAIQPIDFITKNELNWWEGNIVKYATRARRKGQEESDLEKVIHYAQLRLEALRMQQAAAERYKRSDLDAFEPDIHHPAHIRFNLP